MGADGEALRPARSGAEGRIVYAAGVAQGIVLVTFPAASTILTNPADYGLSSSQYGILFLPQVVAAIATALLSGRLARRFSTKLIYLAGLLAGLVSMALLLLSSLLSAGSSLAFALLLIATAFLGAGFGLTVPALNRFAAAFHPDRVDRAVLLLNALLGLGTVLAPLFVARGSRRRTTRPDGIMDQAARSASSASVSAQPSRSMSASALWSSDRFTKSTRSSSSTGAGLWSVLSGITMILATAAPF